MAYDPGPNSGTLNKRDRGVDWNGEVSLENEVLDYIMDCAARGEKVKIEIAGWNKVGPKGEFISIKSNIPYALRGPSNTEKMVNKYAPRVQQEPARGQPGPTNRYAQSAPREEAPAYRPRPGGIAEQAMGRPIQTTRGPYPVQGQRPSTRPGTQQNTQFREELNDEFPENFPGDSSHKNLRNKPGWE